MNVTSFYCGLDEHWVVTPDTDLCDVQTDSNDFKNFNQGGPAKIEPIDGGAHITGAFDWKFYDGAKTVTFSATITTVDHLIPKRDLAAFGCHDYTPLPSDIRAGEFCKSSGLPPGWVAIRALDDKACGSGSYNQWSALYVANLPSGTTLTVCAAPQVPDGWRSAAVWPDAMEECGSNANQRTIVKQ